MTDTPGNWTDHDGGGRPHSPQLWVEIERRDGKVQKGPSACVLWCWPDEPSPFDIMRWREVERPPCVDSAARALVAKLAECQPHIDEAFLHRESRCGAYSGPNYAAERAALKTALGIA